MNTNPALVHLIFPIMLYEYRTFKILVGPNHLPLQKARLLFQEPILNPPALPCPRVLIKKQYPVDAF